MLIKSGGYRWTAADVGWGKQGVAGSKHLKCYLPQGDGRGRLSEDHRDRLTVNVWEVHAAYALFSGDELIYVGEGRLGDRLWKHHRDVRKDLLVGRWDTFSWVSPWEYDMPDLKQANTKAAMVDPGPAITAKVSPKQLVELFELVSVRLCSPPANNQLPTDDKRVNWLLQRRSKHAAPTLESMLKAALGDKDS